MAATVLKNVCCSFMKTQCLLQQSTPALFSGARSYSRWMRKYYKVLYNRRQEIGPEPERHRSVWLNWNYDAEIYAFGHRLGESFNEATLKKAFRHRCYIEQEEQKRVELNVDAEKVPLSMEDNEELVKIGESICSQYVKSYLRHALPLLPEEGICAIHDCLLAEDMLVYVGRNLGISDLILTKDLQVEPATISKTFKAVVGALHEDQGKNRAQLFVQDFILTQLIDKDINEMWRIVNPMGVLEDILVKQNRGPPEPRLLRQTGSETAVSAYVVGIYTDKQLLGQSAGETVFIAEELAARNALNKIFKTTDDRTPFKYGKEGHSLEINDAKENPTLNDYTGKRYIQ